MKKGILLISICIIIALSSVALIIVFRDDNVFYISNPGDFITEKETAIKIGKALLEERFPDSFLNRELPLDAYEKDGIWRVHNVVERSGVTEDGLPWVSLGGELYVDFRKSDGKILGIGFTE